MLFVPQSGNDFSAVASYGTTRPGSTAIFGTTITPGTGAAYGAYSQVGNDLTQDCYGLLININLAFTATIFRQVAIQIGVDYAGGTTFTTIAQDIMVSQANNYSNGGVWLYFPLYIPALSAVAVAARSSVATTFGVNIRYMTAPPNPTMVKRGSFIESLGITLGAGTVTGTSVTPGTTAEGAWTLIGTTTKRCWHWQFTSQHSDTTMTSLGPYHVDLAVGDTSVVGDPKDIILSDAFVRTTISETFDTIPLVTGVEKVVPAGKTIWARIQNAGANENAGTYQVVVYGTGG